ncbi:hypothetical protein Xen7305DRAFT_00001800 [Xenococcus sp. PCC 7305]|nr:hypothetical protein Xen7305DRAFT_00001800 [Xenococcus sp. PCC 7305]
MMWRLIESIIVILRERVTFSSAILGRFDLNVANDTNNRVLEFLNLIFSETIV